MADLAPILPLAPKTPQPPASLPAASGSSTSFGSVLDEAVTSQQRVNEAGNSSANGSSGNRKTAENIHEEGNLTATKSADSSTNEQLANNETDVNTIFSARSSKGADVIESLLKSETVSGIAIALQQNGSGENLTPHMERVASSLLSQLNTSLVPDSSTIPKAELSYQQQTVPTIAYTDLTGGAQNATVTNEAILSNQLRELINANETGTVTITRQQTAEVTLADLQNGTRPLTVAQSLELSATTQSVTIATQTATGNDPLMTTVSQLTRIATPTGDTAVEKPVLTKLETLRQDAQSQFLEAKAEAQNTANTGSSNQQSTQQEAATPTQGLNSQPQLSSTEQTTAFSQTLANMQNPTTAQPQIVTPQPVTLPPGSQIYEENIMNQVTERFQINLRNQETQLQIKLQPAELGELKIDLSIKDGSIKAHVVAQSGKVQEILEKNMARLKELLEDQGLTVEEILVSHKPDNSDSFDLLHENLAKHNRPSGQTSRNFDTSFNETFEDIVTDTESSVTGVNVQA
ncbi:flagellar hook-length control protein FliK [Desulfosediminicola flagellatus]|uniref:flagellar hook-length control protein FliK n=1 Tax=Desulfosediminicola flagellatus TaxID=2569541 RepID=UPI0010AB8149|nr:flagellar hook-length control protein FliK [Desulfosediminicola flagellatus]